ncbi:MAG TPA: dihydropteroate synthase [Gammaproteobacteria bacterium]|jgi:2-amino-4-hydroxy-6-hydroxymethyldihydropteridine diphosphokinase/dihydropteroate synthase|nr:dihydropteroate synthase [Gammaproteobacteria bacterium]
MDVYLGLGSNLGDRRANLSRALTLLPAHAVHVTRVSPVVESPAMLPDDAPTDWNRPFLNVVAECRTEAAPDDLLAALKRIEQDLGRVDRGRWAPRPIDLDILLWGRETLATDTLRVPHPGIAERAFVLTPLASLAPRLTLPGFGPRTVLEHARAGGHHLPLWMGIVNLTPDSFSDGGELADDASVDARVDALVATGAEYIDLGAESTRPGATPLTADQEWARLAPVLERVLERHKGAPLRPRISIDTYHLGTARRALALGVDVINDVSGLTHPAMVDLASSGTADWVAMHNLGVPADKSRGLPADQDPTEAVERWLDERLHEWRRAGLDLSRVVFDPGVGFGKNALQSLKVLRNVQRFQRYGLRMLVGHSRKSFMHHVAAATRDDRDLFTVGASLKLSAQGVDILRVHNVAAHTAAYRGWAHLD